MHFNRDKEANRSQRMRITQTLLFDKLLVDTLAAQAAIQRKIGYYK